MRAANNYALYTEENLTATCGRGSVGASELVIIGKYPSKTTQNGSVAIMHSLLLALDSGSVKLAREFVFETHGVKLFLGLRRYEKSIRALDEKLPRGYKIWQVLVADQCGHLPWHPYYDMDFADRIGQRALPVAERCARFACQSADLDPNCRIMQCSQCKEIKYCSHECQAYSWKYEHHRTECGHRDEDREEFIEPYPVKKTCEKASVDEEHDPIHEMVIRAVNPPTFIKR